MKNQIHREIHQTKGYTMTYMRKVNTPLPLKESHVYDLSV